MIDVNDLRKGTTFTMNGELYKVLEYLHHKPGRGKATIRTTLRDLHTGDTIQHNFISGDKVEDIRVERRSVQYIYKRNNLYYFMDTETYEQKPLSAAALGNLVQYLKPETKVALSTYEGEALEVDLPTTVDLEVTRSELAVAGDTATGTLKKVTLETGLEVRVPLFIEQGDVIKINTETGEYVTRV